MSYADKLRALHRKRDASIVARPNLGNDYSTCFKCGVRILLPRQKGNLCPHCAKEINRKQEIDETTKKFLKSHPGFRQRFKY